MKLENLLWLAGELAGIFQLSYPNYNDVITGKPQGWSWPKRSECLPTVNNTHTCGRQATHMETCCPALLGRSTFTLVLILHSESSMFVSKRRFILKTCGTTLLLQALVPLLELAREYCGFDAIQVGVPTSRWCSDWTRPVSFYWLFSCSCRFHRISSTPARILWSQLTKSSLIETSRRKWTFSARFFQVGNTTLKSGSNPPTIHRNKLICQTNTIEDIKTKCVLLPCRWCSLLYGSFKLWLLVSVAAAAANRELE